MTQAQRSTVGKYFFYGLLVVVALAAWRILLPFLGVMTLAFLTTLMFQPVYQKLLAWTGQRRRTASSLSMVVVVVSFLLPLTLFIQLSVQQAIQIYGDLQSATRGNGLNLQMGVDEYNRFLSSVNLEQYQATVADAHRFIDSTFSRVLLFVIDLAVKTGMNSIEFFAQLMVYFFLLFYLFPLQSKIPRAIASLSPLDNNVDQLFVKKTIEISKSMVRGAFILSAIQAVAGGVLLTVLGVPYTIFWMFLMLFFGILPIVGPTTVMLPIGIFYLAIGNWWYGMLILLYAIIVVSNIDNVLRPQFVSKEADLHPALVLVSVLGGLKLFGAMGLIYGPVVMILLTTMLELHRETLVTSK